jgi:hypothetical protein
MILFDEVDFHFDVHEIENDFDIYDLSYRCEENNKDLDNLKSIDLYNYFINQFKKDSNDCDVIDKNSDDDLKSLDLITNNDKENITVYIEDEDKKVDSSAEDSDEEFGSIEIEDEKTMSEEDSSSENSDDEEYKVCGSSSAGAGGCSKRKENCFILGCDNVVCGKLNKKNLRMVKLYGIELRQKYVCEYHFNTYFIGRIRKKIRRKEKRREVCCIKKCLNIVQSDKKKRSNLKLSNLYKYKFGDHKYVCKHHYLRDFYKFMKQKKKKYVKK